MSHNSLIQTVWGEVQRVFGALKTGEVTQKCPLVTSRVPGMQPAQADEIVDKAIKNVQMILDQRISDLQTWSPKTQQDFQKWFGTTAPEHRNLVLERLKKEKALTENLTKENFFQAEGKYADEKKLFAYVHPNDPKKIFLGEAFANAPDMGSNSRAGTLAHEISHFTVIAGTNDYAYGEKDCSALALADPERALNNADNYEFFLEKL